MEITIQGYQGIQYKSMTLNIDEPLSKELLDKLVKVNGFQLGISKIYDIAIPITVMNEDFIYKKYETHWTEAVRSVTLPVDHCINYTEEDIANIDRINDAIRIRCTRLSISDDVYIVKEDK